MKQVLLPLEKSVLETLAAGTEVLITGVVYTARDRVHKVLATEIEEARRLGRRPRLPFPLAGATIYYCGPTPAPPGRCIGAAGPTTSARMDPFTPALLEAGLRATIGKGKRGPGAVAAYARHGAVHFTTYGGCAALLATHIKSARLVAFPEFGAEAVRELEVADLPAVVTVDCRGAVFPPPNGEKQ